MEGVRLQAIRVLPIRLLSVIGDRSLFGVVAAERDARGERLMSWREDWTEVAACRNGDPDSLFVQGAQQHLAKVVCAGCPVRTECLAEALDRQIEFGVWGGMTERERRAILRRRPNVTSWRALLVAARTEFEAAQARATAVPLPLAATQAQMQRAG